MVKLRSEYISLLSKRLRSIMKEILKQIELVASKLAKSLDMEIISVDYVCEFGMKILRVIASKEPVMTIEDSSALNRLISEELDKLDLIEEEYFLEVSSEGIEKELRTNSDIIKAINEYICIEGFKKIEEQDELYGTLLGLANDVVTIEVNFKGQFRKIDIKKEEIKKIRLAVKF
jgi:ribosome maturation factor RimP